MDNHALIYSIKNDLPDANESLKKILPEFEGSIIKTFSTYTSQSGICMTDIAEDKYLVLHRAIKTYDPKHNTKLNSWVTNVARFHCLNLLRQQHRHEAATGYEPEELNRIIDARYSQKENKVNDCADLREVIAEYAAKGTIRLQKIVRLRFLEDREYTYAQIGKKVGVSAEAIRLILDKFIKELKSKLK